MLVVREHVGLCDLESVRITVEEAEDRNIDDVKTSFKELVCRVIWIALASDDNTVTMRRSIVETVDFKVSEDGLSWSIIIHHENLGIEGVILLSQRQGSIPLYQPKGVHLVPPPVCHVVGRSRSLCSPP